MTTISVELTFTESILGTKPIKSDLWKEYLAKRKIAATPADELSAAERLEADLEDKETQGTAFQRDKNGNPMLWDYQVNNLACCMFLAA